MKYDKCMQSLGDRLAQEILVEDLGKFAACKQGQCVNDQQDEKFL